MKLDVFSLDKKKVGDIELKDEVFAADVNKALFYEVVKSQLASRRRGTHMTKTKADVRGGGKKPWKQKHTGNARTGSTRNPNWVGGGVAFGPKPRDYSYRLPRKVRKGALRSALSLRAKEKALTVLDVAKLDAIKTKQVVAMLEKFGVESALIVDKKNQNLMLSTRNLVKAKYLQQEGINVYDVLRYKHLFLTKEAALKLQEGLIDE
jgi:large subunit ribosomal protein L4